MMAKSVWIASVLLIIIAGCSFLLPCNVDRKQSYAFVDTIDTYLGRDLQKSISEEVTKDGFVLLETGF